MSLLIADVPHELTSEDRDLARWIYEGVPPTQVAEWMGVSLRTVWTRVGRLKDKLERLNLQLHVDRGPRQREIRQLWPSLQKQLALCA